MSSQCGGRHRSMFAHRPQTSLGQLKLHHILNGDTCSPISFTDFADFVTHKDHSSENILFVLWFRDYKENWSLLEQDIRRGVPIPSTSLQDRHEPFAYLDAEYEISTCQSKQRSEGLANPVIVRAHRTRLVIDGNENDSFDTKETEKGRQRSSKLLSVLSNVSTRTSSTLEVVVTTPTTSCTLTYPPLPPPGTTFLPPEEQPMRKNAYRGFETFLQKGGCRELSISDDLREFVELSLAKSTAPECFLPVYEEIHHIVETQCIPRFLEAAKSGANRPKQLLWYLLGLLNLLVGLIIFLTLTLVLPSHPFGNRAYRLISTIFISLGAMKLYLAYCNFCSQLWKRSQCQVRPWNRTEPNDQEAQSGEDGFDVAMAAMNENTYTKEERSTGTDLPPEVRPLSNVGAIEGFEVFDSNHVPMVPRSDDSFKASSKDTQISVLPANQSIQSNSEFLTEAEQQQYEIRRATMKRPNTADAFPIRDDRLDFTSQNTRGRLRNVGNNQSASSQPMITSSFVPLEDSDCCLTVPLSANQNSSRHFAELLTQLNHTSASSRRCHLPIGCCSPFSKNHQHTCVSFPQTIMEDPRINKAYRNIKRDIFSVGIVTFFIWVVLCLVVPCAGLVSREQ
ncbi:hypothetical protein L204_100863 [Cryptococcus depauperatus]